MIHPVDTAGEAGHPTLYKAIPFGVVVSDKGSRTMMVPVSS